MELENEMNETKEKRKLDVPILERFIRQLNQEVYTRELKLQTEENGTKIAQLQGFIAGARTYKTLMNDAGFVNARTDDREELFFSIDDNGDEECSLNPQGVEASNIMAQAFILMPEYKEFQEKRQARVEDAKNDLFFYSDKGRDLYWYRDWFKALTKIDEWIEILKSYFYRLQAKKEQAAKQAREELPFEEQDA
ncbi:MAG: hypothetical protein ACTTKX_02200 [Treponema sp.]